MHDKSLCTFLMVLLAAACFIIGTQAVSTDDEIIEVLLDRGVIKYTADEKTGETYLIVTETGERIIQETGTESQ